MTGEKNRGTTQEKLWNLDDKSLATPAHDELVLKLLDKEYVKKLFSKELDCFFSKHAQCMLDYEKKIINYHHDINIISEKPLENNNRFLIGYIDIYVEWGYIIDDPNYSSSLNKVGSLVIEVKPKIDSFGTTLRQLMTYKHYLHTDIIYLFTPDLRFKDAFESQGIKVISPLMED